MEKTISEVVYSIHFTDAEFKRYAKIADKYHDGDLSFFDCELLKIKDVVGVTSFAWCQYSIHIQIQTEYGSGFSNIAQSCYIKLKDLIK